MARDRPGEEKNTLASHCSCRFDLHSGYLIFVLLFSSVPRVELRARDRTLSLPHIFFMFISTVFYQLFNKLKVDHIMYKCGRYVRNKGLLQEATRRWSEGWAVAGNRLRITDVQKSLLQSRHRTWLPGKQAAWLGKIMGSQARHCLTQTSDFQIWGSFLYHCPLHWGGVCSHLLQLTHC